MGKSEQSEKRTLILRWLLRLNLHALLVRTWQVLLWPVSESDKCHSSLTPLGQLPDKLAAILIDNVFELIRERDHKSPLTKSLDELYLSFFGARKRVGIPKRIARIVKQIGKGK